MFDTPNQGGQTTSWIEFLLGIFGFAIVAKIIQWFFTGCGGNNSFGGGCDNGGANNIIQAVEIANTRKENAELNQRILLQGVNDIVGRYVGGVSQQVSAVQNKLDVFDHCGIKAHIVQEYAPQFPVPQTFYTQQQPGYLFQGAGFNASTYGGCAC